jgi:hypothetical protein
MTMRPIEIGPRTPSRRCHLPNNQIVKDQSPPNPELVRVGSPALNRRQKRNRFHDPVLSHAQWSSPLVRLPWVGRAEFRILRNDCQRGAKRFFINRLQRLRSNPIRLSKFPLSAVILSAFKRPTRPVELFFGQPQGLAETAASRWCEAHS